MNELTDEMLEAFDVDLLHLSAGGVSVVLDTAGGGLPAVLHWGAELGSPEPADLAQLRLAAQAPFGDSRIDVPERVSVLPTPAEGWVGRPGVTGSSAGQAFSPMFTVVAVEPVAADAVVAAGHRFRAADATAELALVLEIRLTHSGLLQTRAALTNEGSSTYQLDGLVMALPLPTRAAELFDLTGRHARERAPQRADFTVGIHARESRQGRPGLDSPFLLAAGTAGFGWERGQVWGVHVGWSGNQVSYAERMYNGQRLLGGGELLLPGEVQLAPGETYTSPWLHAAFGAGLNGVSRAFHHYLRSRPQHPRTPRPVVANTWEASYFDHDLTKLSALAERAAEAGAERFVLDDGWFLGRRDDTSGLGDWTVDPAVWPNGLKPLIDRVDELGMQFGLWVEPEMINLDSELARAHPEWIFRAGGRAGIATRQQYVLDLGHPEAYAYIADCLHALLDEYDIGYLKWDHNRMVVEAGHWPTGVPGVHRHTRAVYRLMDELRARHPGLEIESCAGGGGRIDLGILDRTDRVWPSDCLDALERQQIQRYTQLLVPPELMGTHLGDAEAHTTRRRHHIAFRAATAVWGHMGIEWDLTAASPGKRAEVRRWVDLHKSLRPLLHSGDVVVGDHPDPALWVNGVVAQDRSEAIFGITAVDRSVTFPLGRVCLPGLAADRHYEVRPLPPADAFPGARQFPGWWTTGVTLSGRALAEVGLQVPAMFPDCTHIIRARAVPAAPVTKE
ncbi:alpha-galactosidase [Nakamurella sp.]|uniref:alpha-galactosidase n=1 Tax=Nakamurella sp. TaxID=1869182 RepID=UPI003B3A9E4C